MKLRGIIFDLDGTLANTLPVCFAAFREVFRSYLGQDYTDRQVYAMFGPSEEGIFNSRIPQQSNKALADYLGAYERLHRICPEPFSGIQELLKSLQKRGIRRAVVTGKGAGSAAISLRVLGLGDSFDSVWAGVPSRGDKPTAMKSVLNAWGFAPVEVASIGDSRSDIDAAKENGLIPLGAAWAETADFGLLVAHDPLVVFRSVKEFSNWVKKHTAYDHSF